MHINILLFIHHSGVHFFSEEAHTLLSQNIYLLKNVNIKLTLEFGEPWISFPFATLITKPYCQTYYQTKKIFLMY